MKAALLFLLIALCVFSPRNALACTVFHCHRGNKVLVGNNEDWQYSTDVEVWFVSPTGKSYGRVCFGWSQLFVPRQAQGGMNDQGLFLDWALCPKSTPPAYSFSKKIAGLNFSDNLLAECATVDEAVAWLKQYYIAFIRSHIMVVDRRGNSAVVEWVDGAMKVIRKKHDYQVMTNFLLTHPELGDYPCPRYDTVTKMMQGKREISVDYFASILKMVSQYKRSSNGRESGTVYSNVYDVTNGDVYIYYKRNYENPIRFNLKTELAKGNHSFHLDSLR